MAIDDLMGALGNGRMFDVLGGEELVIEAARDIVKDELKARIRETMEADPELKEEVQRAIGRYFEAKVLEAFASLSLAKAGAKVGVEALPPELRNKLERQVAGAIEKELASVLERAL